MNMVSWVVDFLTRVSKISYIFAYHSKLRLIYPKTKMPKNCTRLDIKTGASLRCEKVRKNQKRVCSLKEWGFIGPKPPRSILAKYDLKRGCFLLLKTGPKGPISPKNCLKGLWLTMKLIDITSSSTFVNDFLPELNSLSSNSYLIGILMA